MFQKIRSDMIYCPAAQRILFHKKFMTSSCNGVETARRVLTAKLFMTGRRNDRVTAALQKHYGKVNCGL